MPNYLKIGRIGKITANELKTQENFRLAFNELDYDMFIIQFECFLKKRLRSSKSINAYMKDIRQYIDWNNFENISESLVVNEKKRCNYKFYILMELRC